jgi:hypothetical protein
MRLTVEVLPLTDENAHGPYSPYALKGRRFALPVGKEDTFEAVWAQIEHRYKTSYLDAQQAANFTIKKLQDAYDCDLFMTDTVGSIFEGETDAAMRMIKVVPTFLNRHFSVPGTTSLRPAHAQKRIRALERHEPSKRRRTDQATGSVNHDDLDDLDGARDQPVLSTEHSPQLCKQICHRSVCRLCQSNPDRSERVCGSRQKRVSGTRLPAAVSSISPASARSFSKEWRIQAYSLQHTRWPTTSGGRFATRIASGPWCDRGHGR